MKKNILFIVNNLNLRNILNFFLEDIDYQKINNYFYRNNQDILTVVLSDYSFDKIIYEYNNFNQFKEFYDTAVLEQKHFSWLVIHNSSSNIEFHKYLMVESWLTCPFSGKEILKFLGLNN